MVFKLSFDFIAYISGNLEDIHIIKGTYNRVIYYSLMANMCESIAMFNSYATFFIKVLPTAEKYCRHR